MAQRATSDNSHSGSRARSVALVGLSIAIVAVCSWIIIPFGPIPFTLQMFAIPLMICILTPGQAVAAIAGYLLLGVMGVPVFSGMRGGLGVVLGPTGGFLMGYLPGVLLAALLVYLTQPAAVRYRERRIRRADEHMPVRSSSDAPKSVSVEQGDKASADVPISYRPSAWRRMRADLLSCVFQLLAGLVFTFVAYATGWLWFMFSSGVSAEAAFVACIAPFILPDIAKVIAAVIVAQPIRATLSR